MLTAVLSRSCSPADIMVGMGYTREEVTESLTRMKYDEITATYLLLGRKSTEVRGDLAMSESAGSSMY